MTTLPSILPSVRNKLRELILKPKKLHELLKIALKAFAEYEISSDYHIDVDCHYPYINEDGKWTISFMSACQLLCGFTDQDANYNTELCVTAQTLSYLNYGQIYDAYVYFNKIQYKYDKYGYPTYSEVITPAITNMVIQRYSNSPKQWWARQQLVYKKLKELDY